MSAKKDISYLGKDFKSIRKNLIDFTKQYFPDTYNDFSEGSSGMLLIELASYVGDVLSYYSDTNLKESLLTQATEQTNIMDLIRSLGYQPKNITPAHVTLDVYQLLPASGSGTNVTPDFNYALYINKNLIVKQSDGPAVFRTLDAVDFRQQSSLSTNDVSANFSKCSLKSSVLRPTGNSVTLILSGPACSYIPLNIYFCSPILFICPQNPS